MKNILRVGLVLLFVCSVLFAFTACRDTGADELPPTPSEGLAFTLNRSGRSYTVSGIGSCTDTEIVIPAEYNGLPVTKIGDNAFADITAITAVHIPDSVVRIGMYAFAGTSITSITIPAGVTELTALSLNGAPLENIAVAWDNPVYKTVGGVLYTADGRHLLRYPKMRHGERYTVPEGVVFIAHSAFRDAEYLVTVSLPESLEFVADFSFSGAKRLECIVIPDGVTELGEGAFNSCPSLDTLVIGSGVKKIRYWSVSDCDALLRVLYHGRAFDWAGVNLGTSNDSITKDNLYFYSENEPAASGNYWHYVDGVPTPW